MPELGATQASQHWRWIIVLGAVALIALLAACATEWRREAAHHRSASRDLDAAQMQVAQLRARLSTVTAVSGERRRTILQRVDGVLGRIGPLLASSDALRQAASTVEGMNNTFATDASALQDDVVELATRLSTRAGGATADAVAKVSGEMAALQSDLATLSGRSGRLDSAASLFGTRAAEYTGAVRALQAELRP